jgi:hypothetical protein
MYDFVRRRRRRSRVEIAKEQTEGWLSVMAATRICMVKSQENLSFRPQKLQQLQNINYRDRL